MEWEPSGCDEPYLPGETEPPGPKGAGEDSRNGRTRDHCRTVLVSYKSSSFESRTDMTVVHCMEEDLKNILSDESNRVKEIALRNFLYT